MRKANRVRLPLLLILSLVSVPALARRARATEARPWLCREIPVFSDSKPMTWRAAKRGGGSWLMTFMHYDPAGGGHDGFTVVAEREVGRQAQGTLDAGQYYAVALYRSGSHWICPGNASEVHESAGGTIKSLCYGADDGSCDLKLTVGSTGAAGSHQP